MHIYHRTTSVGQEFKHGLAGSFVSGPLTRCNQSVIQVGVLFEGLSGEGSPKLPPAIGRIQFFQDCWTEDLSFYLTVEPSVLAMWDSFPCSYVCHPSQQEK